MKIKSFIKNNIILFFLLFIQYLLSTEKKDSLQILIDSENNYTKKIELYQKIINQIKTQDFEKTIILSDEALYLAKKNNDEISKANLLRLKGNAYYFRGEFENCSHYFFKSLEILNKKPPSKNLIFLYNDFGRLYRKLKDYPRALKNYDLAFLAEKSLKDDELLATLYNESGIVYEEMGNYNEAKNRYKKSLEIQEKRGDLVGQGYSLEFIGGVYLLQKKYSESEKYLLKSLEIRKKTKDSFAIALNFNVLGNLFSEKKDFSKAEQNYIHSNNIAKKINYLDLQQLNYHQLSKIYKEIGKYNLAYQNLESFRLINEKIFSLEKIKQVEEISTKYETAEKDKEILVQKNKILKKNILVFSLIGILLLGLIYYKNYQHRQEKKLQKEIYKHQELATKALFEGEQNERIRIARDLHDSVGQMLSLVKMNLSTQEQNPETEKTQNLVDKTILEVRSISHNLIPEELNFGIFSALENLADKVNATSQTKMKLHISEEIREIKFQKQNELSIYRIVQEVVNNMIKHADASLIDLSIKKIENSLIINIRDNGKGMNDDAIEQSSGIGWKNIKARVNMMSGNLKIESEKLTGTQIEITLPQNG